MTLNQRESESKDGEEEGKSMAWKERAGPCSAQHMASGQKHAGSNGIARQGKNSGADCGGDSKARRRAGSSTLTS
jgi:hypothetical protein